MRLVYSLIRIFTDAAEGSGEGNIIEKNLESKTIEQLLAEAEELIQQINSES